MHKAHLLWLVLTAACTHLGETTAPELPPTTTPAATRDTLPRPDSLIRIDSLARPDSLARRDTLTFAAVGDIMLGTSFPEGYLSPNDGQDLLTPAHAALQAADFAFGNQEGALFNGVGQPKQCRDTARCYAFKSPEHYARYLSAAGFDLISVANNHSGDFGPAARLRTMEVLEESGMTTAGRADRPYAILRRGGITIGLAAFAPNRGTAPLNNLAYAQSVVRRLDSLCDIVVVSFHGGAEGSAHQHVTRKRELFAGEDRGNVYQFAHRMIEAGADLLLGHGPHVVRALDLYRGRLIAYSLGNFATYGRFNLKGPNSFAPLLQVRLHPDGRFIEGAIIPFIQEGEGGPRPDPSGAAIAAIRQLTAEDIPEAPLRITADGRIHRKE